MATFKRSRMRRLLQPFPHGLLLASETGGLFIFVPHLRMARGGKDAMAPHISAAMAAADSGFELDYGELREYGHGMYAEVAEALCESFALYLPACLDKALASLRLDDGVLYDSDEEAKRGLGTNPYASLLLLSSARIEELEAALNQAEAELEVPHTASCSLALTLVHNADI